VVDTAPSKRLLGISHRVQLSGGGYPRYMSIEVVFETHALSEDNERGIAAGWLPGRRTSR
jgi:hypothetical protein